MPVMGPGTPSKAEIDDLYGKIWVLLHQHNILNYAPHRIWKPHREELNNKLRTLVEELIQQDYYESF